MSDEIFEVINNEADGRFEIHLDDKVAYAEYRVLASGVLFPHTEVPVFFEGRGVGSALVKAAMAWVRERQLLVMPACTFVAGYIQRHPDLHDMVHPGYRAALGI
ncbi:GNAT family N-acetyltransferase [Caulobacter sp. 73W]|uniref:GNAT family N-acetyltransferase n=1 Tax=Caulobacter sp. 73W TaxID=3161137 RepID=A0AB39KT97_9CAUL